METEKNIQKAAIVKYYTMLLLKPGSKPLPDDESKINQLQMGHLAHLFTMEKEGKRSVFEPVVNSQELSGIFVFNKVNKDDIHQWMANDPYIKAGHLTYELYDWFIIPRRKIPG